jgi:hypothetical protein
MSCGGGHLGFPYRIKNKTFVEDLQMIIPQGNLVSIVQVVSERKSFETLFP